jgi:hypothetical protein
MTLSDYGPKCGWMRSAGYGALTSVIGVDRLLGGFGAPPAVHWALAGAAADYQCRNYKFTPDKEYAMNMAYGYGGGFVASMLLGR